MENSLALVRALINDTQKLDYDETGELRYLLSDEALLGFIELNSGGVYGASADALRSIATNEVLIGKVIRTQDLATDGAKVGTELRLQARELDSKQSKQDDAEANESFAFEIVDFHYPYNNPEDFLGGF